MAENINLYLGLDLKPTITVPQYDSGRTLNIYLQNYSIPSNSEVYIYVKKPSGHEIFYTCEYEDNLIVVEGTLQMFAEVGASDANIQIITGGKYITSFPFIIVVTKNAVADMDFESTDDYTAFVESISAAQTWDQRASAAEEQFEAELEEKVQEVEERIQEALTEAEYISGIVSTLDDRYVNVSGDTMTGPLQVQKGSYVHYIPSDNTSTQYVLAATFTITSLTSETNAPIGIEFIHKGSTQSTILWITFKGGAAPSLESFYYIGAESDCYMVNNSGSFNLYLKKYSNDDSFTILMFKPNTAISDYVSIQWESQFLSSLPDGNVQAEFYNSASSLGDSSVGSGTRPIYLDSGVPVASTSTVGSKYTPIYLNGGNLTASDATIGNSKTLLYMSNGELTASDGNAGSSQQPIYMQDGELKPIDATIGSPSKPVYLNEGRFTPIDISAGSSTTPVYINNGAFTPFDATVGSSTTPIYMDNGRISPLQSTIGSSNTPVYLKNGSITSCTDSVGSIRNPVYLNGGTLTKCNFNIYWMTVVLTFNNGTASIQSSQYGITFKPLTCVCTVNNTPTPNWAIMAYYDYDASTSSTMVFKARWVSGNNGNVTAGRVRMSMIIIEG